ncbi:DUF647-domain-containing protein [Leucogyrophana mollusca]|uniref:DUF647-domain-containing protein n=1 Tax=Leucogyrophana mollusca TaxID=85980 RepID=A0ACB8BJM7_9AGAM|nr:DUF647-domain-containing protein [Leucogyrophana mollusca]
MPITLVERDETGQLSQTLVNLLGEIPKNDRWSRIPQIQSVPFSRLRHVLANVFLPTGYPATVSPDYLHYQVFNALQAFCSSLAGLIASRGVLEGFGVGNASASATQALLLTVLQDVFSRLTTISAAYVFGTSLYPETKMFRFLADVLNDASLVLDTLSPFLGTISLSFSLPLLPSGSALRIIALCLSGSLRALCGLVAGGSKAALTNHFASPVSGKGDVGELNAKDASRETVVGLTGLLLGTLIIPYLSTPSITYSALCILITGHLIANYLAVRGVVLKSINRQRASLLWAAHRNAAPTGSLDPQEISAREHIFVIPSELRKGGTGRLMGHCKLGASARAVLPYCRSDHTAAMLRQFEKERYVLFISATRPSWIHPKPLVFACFKKDYEPLDQLRAWVHALDVAELLAAVGGSVDPDMDTLLIRRAHERVLEVFPGFIESLKVAGWVTSTEGLMLGSPQTVLVSVREGPQQDPGDGDRLVTRKDE